MWEELKLEKILVKALSKQFQPSKAARIYADYIVARDELLVNLLEDIKSTNPNLTDHGPRHIENVIINVEKLLEDKINDLSGLELYILLISILFHDVGNFLGRKLHNRKISEIFNQVRNNDSKFDQERNAVLSIAGAHTGFSKDGSGDTLKEVNEAYFVKGEKIRGTLLAGILRFADELAEGSQRTSKFMQAYHKYSEESLPYHTYAQITEHSIDRAGNRIAIDYYLNLIESENKILIDNSIELDFILEFICKRIHKLNNERKYCRYYCHYLEPYKKISINFTILKEGQILDVNFPPLTLDDLVVPTDEIFDLNRQGYWISNLRKLIKETIKSTNGEFAKNGFIDKFKNLFKK